MKRLLFFCALVASACSNGPDAAIAVSVTIDRTVQSSHVIVSASGGDVTLSTKCMAIDNQRILDVGVKRGSLPATVKLTAVGFSDASCQSPTVPPETAGAGLERTFKPGNVVDAPLTLRADVPPLETNCGNGVDDDRDGQLDCLDLDCTARACSTGSVCVEGQTCQNGACQGGAVVSCATPPSSCFMGAGLCVSDAGCRYLPNTGAGCDDSNECTQSDRCDTSGLCVGTQRPCNQPPPGPCWMSTGQCVPDAGCTYAPAVGTSCADSDPCTIMDQCQADGGCSGTPLMCAPRECATPTGACSADAGCLYAPLDAGTACGSNGACNSQGGCLPPFPFVPSNVSINDIPAPASGKVTFNCGTTTIDSSGSGAPNVTNPCPSHPPLAWAHITQNGGISTLVLAFDDLEIAGGSALQFTGARPVIVVSLNDINVLGAIVAAAGTQSCASGGAGGNGAGIVFRSGGGGGGFATVGGSGGPVNAGNPGGGGGAVNVGPQLRGGCPGGIGGGSAARAAAGGGALQLVALDLLTIAGPVTAPGEGGQGGGFGNGGNGGGSGGEILLEASTVVASSGGLTCNGGGGGEAGTNNDGQSGQLTTMAANGGSDGVLGGAGGDGAAGSTAAENGEATGGGGGGGVGRIRINVTMGCNIGPQVVISPPATSNKPDAGCP